MRGDVAPIQRDPECPHAESRKLRKHLRLMVGRDPEQIAGRLEERCLAVARKRRGCTHKKGEGREEG